MLAPWVCSYAVACVCGDTATGVTVPTSQLMLAQPESDLVTTVGSGGGFRSVRFWHDQLFAKPPHHGGNVAWYAGRVRGLTRMHTFMG